MLSPERVILIHLSQNGSDLLSQLCSSNLLILGAEIDVGTVQSKTPNVLESYGYQINPDFAWIYKRFYS